MKTSHFFYILLAILLSSCNFGQDNYEFEDYGYDSEYSEEYYEEGQGGEYAQNFNQGQNNYQQNRTSNTSEIKMHQIKSDQFGMLFGEMPIPSNWKRSNGKEGVYFEGPGGVQVYNEISNSFFYSNDAQRNQFAQQNGSQVKPVKSLERFISEDFKPMAEQQGSRLVRQYPFTQLAQNDQKFDRSLFKSTPENKQYQCVITEWADKDGKKSMVIIRYFVNQYTAIGGMDWGYTINGMDASPEAFEGAKNAYINALVNFRYNPQWIQANNRHYAQMTQQNNASHQQRMAQIKAFGAQNTARHNARMAASDARHSAWMNGQASSDASQAAYVDGIWERQNMTDSQGNQYKVDGYDNNVWMNQNNEYIGTDNPNWNPNIDNDTNDYNWEQLQSTDDGWN